MARRIGPAVSNAGGMTDADATSLLRRATIWTMPATTEPEGAVARRMLAAHAKLAKLQARVLHDGEPPLPLVLEARAVLVSHGLDTLAERLDG